MAQTFLMQIKRHRFDKEIEKPPCLIFQLNTGTSLFSRVLRC